MFLLGVEEGAFVGCDENFSKSLGAPVGPAVEKNDTIERHFKSETYGIFPTIKEKLSGLINNNCS